MPLADEQPKDGELIVHCGHLRAKTHHWWHPPEPVPMSRPDGSKVKVNWLMACEPCFIAAEGELLKINFTGEVEWCGNAPLIKVDLN